MFLFFIIPIVFTSDNYQIPSYYGSKELDFLLRKSIINGNLSSFYWHPSVSKNDNTSTFYLGYKNAIFEIDKDNRSKIIAGSSSGKSGFRDGDAASSLFNNIKSVIYFSKNETLAKQEYTKQTIILANNNTECLNVDSTNFTQCLDTQSDPVDPYRIKDVYKEQSVPQEEFKEFLYIVDSGNHCIRQIDLQKKITKTIAGICGQSGFKDGLLGMNLFNTPDQMGIDVLGNIFVNDFNNHFIRMITLDGYVNTLISGSCRQDVRYQDIQFDKLNLKRVICLKTWIKTSGQPSDHLVVLLMINYQNIKFSKNYDSPQQQQQSTKLPLIIDLHKKKEHQIKNNKVQSKSMHHGERKNNFILNSIITDVNEMIKQYHVSVFKEDQGDKSVRDQKKTKQLWLQENENKDNKLITQYQLLELRLKQHQIKKDKSTISIQGNRLQTISTITYDTISKE
ncbi:unnamed protein product (macronuclear) [Paramecium tetraurelia]|uniref:Peptidase A1 domain-containing protein n=1 Tax=Paramecium tetraurelia TaxID=5888 RepID=A0BUY2_PARTE|nr:uncharacterized protein GSPATT00005595001 [Paramecium tetraurelia]CAK62349.1 unnamed protein product [Paramecium tetraurelia]|eukprot:XP_001429747.1 hypothetical protein (macronuclear) [Paramecium tetraurelia strain d4-2]